MNADDPNNLVYPVLVAPALYGVDCLISNGQPLDRHCNPIPNRSIAEMLQGMPAFMGTIVVGDPTADDCFQRSYSAVKSPEGFSKFVLWVYDILTHGSYTYIERLDIARHIINACSKNFQLIDHELVKSPSTLMKYKKLVLSEGYKDIFVCDPAERRFRHSIEGNWS